MPYQLPDGRLISPDVAFTLNEIQYPANFLRLSTEEEKQALGIVWVDPGPSWDQRFWWGYDQDGKLIPKDHADLVGQWIGNTRQTANSLLSPTDWQVVREADNGTAMDPAWKSWRESVRLAANEKVLYIGTTNDTDELAAYITGSAYPIWPDDPDHPVSTENLIRARDEQGRFIADDPLTPVTNEAWTTSAIITN